MGKEEKEEEKKIGKKEEREERIRRRDRVWKGGEFRKKREYQNRGIYKYSSKYDRKGMMIRVIPFILQRYPYHKHDLIM